MPHHLHHVHLFASDVERSVRFYAEHFGAEVVLDAELAGARHVFLRIGSGRIHLYDQAPQRPGRASIHHIGIQTDDIEGTVKSLEEAGVELRKEVTDFGVWKYVMVPAPDDVLVELFEVRKRNLPPALRDFFE